MAEFQLGEKEIGEIEELILAGEDIPVEEAEEVLEIFADLEKDEDSPSLIDQNQIYPIVPGDNVVIIPIGINIEGIRYNRGKVRRPTTFDNYGDIVKNEDEHEEEGAVFGEGGEAREGFDYEGYEEVAEEEEEREKGRSKVREKQRLKSLKRRLKEGDLSKEEAAEARKELAKEKKKKGKSEKGQDYKRKAQFDEYVERVEAEVAAHRRKKMTKKEMKKEFEKLFPHGAEETTLQFKEKKIKAYAVQGREVEEGIGRTKIFSLADDPEKARIASVLGLPTKIDTLLPEDVKQKVYDRTFFYEDVLKMKRGAFGILFPVHDPNRSTGILEISELQNMVIESSKFVMPKWAEPFVQHEKEFKAKREKEYDTYLKQVRKAHKGELDFKQYAEQAKRFDKLRVEAEIRQEFDKYVKQIRRDERLQAVELYFDQLKERETYLERVRKEYEPRSDNELRKEAEREIGLKSESELRKEFGRSIQFKTDSAIRKEFEPQIEEMRKLHVSRAIEEIRTEFEQIRKMTGRTDAEIRKEFEQLHRFYVSKEDPHARLAANPYDDRYNLGDWVEFNAMYAIDHEGIVLSTKKDSLRIINPLAGKPYDIAYSDIVSAEISNVSPVYVAEEQQEWYRNILEQQRENLESGKRSEADYDPAGLIFQIPMYMPSFEPIEEELEGEKMVPVSLVYGYSGTQFVEKRFEVKHTQPAPLNIVAGKFAKIWTSRLPPEPFVTTGVVVGYDSSGLFVKGDDGTDYHPFYGDVKSKIGREKPAFGLSFELRRPTVTVTSYYSLPVSTQMRNYAKNYIKEIFGSVIKPAHEKAPEPEKYTPIYLGPKTPFDKYYEGQLQTWYLSVNSKAFEILAIDDNLLRQQAEFIAKEQNSVSTIIMDLSGRNPGIFDMSSRQMLAHLLKKNDLSILEASLQIALSKRKYLDLPELHGREFAVFLSELIHRHMELHYPNVETIFVALKSYKLAQFLNVKDIPEEDRTEFKKEFEGALKEKWKEYSDSYDAEQVKMKEMRGKQTVTFTGIKGESDIETDITKGVEEYENVIYSSYGETTKAYLEKLLYPVVFLRPNPIGMNAKFFKAKIANGQFKIRALYSADLGAFLPEISMNRNLSLEQLEDVNNYVLAILIEEMNTFLKTFLFSSNPSIRRVDVPAAPYMFSKFRDLFVDIYKVCQADSKSGYRDGKPIPLGEMAICLSKGVFTCHSVHDVVNRLRKGDDMNPFTNEPYPTKFIDKMKSFYTSGGLFSSENPKSDRPVNEALLSDIVKDIGYEKFTITQIKRRLKTLGYEWKPEYKEMLRVISIKYEIEHVIQVEGTTDKSRVKEAYNESYKNQWGDLHEKIFASLAGEEPESLETQTLGLTQYN
jgi:hypothetical protein